jgi:macrocin-O-methyltransferase TylF-like protien
MQTLWYASDKLLKRALIDLIPKPARRLLRSINDFAVRNLFAPPTVKFGWRPAHYTPAEAVYLGIHFGYDEEDQIKTASAVIREYTMVSFERLATLWQQVRYLDRYSIPGALVKCGVWRDGSAGMMVIARGRW